MLGAVIKFCIITPKSVTKNKFHARQLFPQTPLNARQLLHREKIGLEENSKFKLSANWQIAPQRTTAPTQHICRLIGAY